MTARELIEVDGDQIKELWFGSLSNKEIAEKLGVGIWILSDRAARLGLPPRTKARKSRPDVKLPDCDKFREMWASGKSVGDIAAAFDCGSSIVWSNAKKYGYPKRGRLAEPAPKPVKAMKVVSFPPKTAAAPIKAQPPLATDFWTTDRDAAVIATTGKYAKVAALADRWGIPSQRIMTRWQKLRVAA